MAKKLRRLIGRDLRFIDENQEKTGGTLMYIENYFNLDGGLRNYFFIPYNEKSPFRIFSKGPNRICISTDHKEIYGHSNNYNRLANEGELESLAQFEGLMKMCDPAAEIQERGGPCLIKLPNEKYTKTVSEMNFPQAFAF